MTHAKAIARLRRLAEDWRHEEKQLCEHFGNDIVPQSMRARIIKDTQALGAAVKMIERMKVYETALREIAWSNDTNWQADRARAALEESK